MNKIILLLLLITGSLVIAGEEQGSGTNPNTTTSSETVYQLVCAPVSAQDSSQNCVIVEVQIDN